MSDTATLAVYVTGATVRCDACGTAVDLEGGNWRARANVWFAVHRMPRVAEVHTTAGTWRRRD